MDCQIGYLKSINMFSLKNAAKMQNTKKPQQESIKL